MALVMSVCEKCLKYNQLVYDDEGIGVMKPSPAEFNLRLTLTSSSARQALIGPSLSAPLSSLSELTLCSSQDRYDSVTQGAVDLTMSDLYSARESLHSLLSPVRLCGV
jgi:hypothetical protein